MPPVPPVPPVSWRRKEPIGALILIGFGLLLLLNQMGFLAEHVLKFLWPLRLYRAWRVADCSSL